MTNKLWDDVKKSLQDIGNIAAEKGKVFSRAAADKAEELTRAGKIKLDVVQVNRDIERNFTELGGKVYHLKSEDALDTIDEATEIQAIFDKIKVLEEKKEALEEKLKAAGQAEEHTKTSASSATEESATEETAAEDFQTAKSDDPDEPKSEE